MDDIIVRTLQGRATADEQAALARWRRESPVHEQRYREMEEVWNLSGAPGPAPARPNAAAIRARVGGRDGAGWWMRRLAAAAVVLVTVGASLAVWGLGRRAGWSRYEADGAPLTLTLPDGSFARLSAGSRLAMRVVRAERSVRLSGRAFFAVARDASAPFRVSTEAGEVQVLGTRFEVDGRGDSLGVVVIEGRVAVRNAWGDAEVVGGQVARADRGRAPAVRTVDDVYRFTDARGPVFLYQNSPLADVVSELEARFARTIAIDDSTLRTRGVTARFDGESFDEILRILCDVTGAQCDLAASPARIAP